MYFDAFQPIDRFKPDGDNDERQTIGIANTLDQARGRTPPPRVPGKINQRHIADDVRRFQRTHGLKPDGIVHPKGPTIQRAQALVHERNPSPPHRRLIGRGADVPIYGSVGKGQTNLPRDLEVVRAGLGLIGPRDKSGLPIVRKAGKGSKAKDGLHDIIASFQRNHGLKADGVIEPFGPTHDMMDHLLRPQVERLTGNDPEQPNPFKPQPPQIVARTLTFRPSTIRTFYQDAATQDSAADHADAQTLRAATSGEMAMVRQYNAERGEASDAATDQADVTVADAEREAQTPEPVVKDDPNSSLLKQADPTLTERQIAEATQQAQDQGIDLSDPAAAQAFAARYGEQNPDHHTPLETALAEGQLTADELEQRLERQARMVRQDPGNREANRRLEAQIDTLASHHLKQAQAQGIDVDETAIRQRLKTMMTAATTGEINMEAAGEMLMLAADFAPVVGELKSAYEAVELYKQLQEAHKNGDTENIGALQASFLLSVAGAVPFVGKIAKGAKLGMRITETSAKLGKADPIRMASEQLARRKLAKMEGDFDKTFTAHSPQLMLKPEAMKNLSPEELESLTALFNRVKGRQGEAYLKTVLDKAGLTRPMGDKNYLRRYTIKPSDGSKELVRHFDEVVEERTKTFLKVFHIKRKDTGQGTAYEIKTDNSQLSTNQKKFAEAQSELNPKASPSKKAKKAGIGLPADIGGESRNLRIALKELPEDQVVATLESAMKKADTPFSQKQIEAMTQSVKETYALVRSAEKQGQSELASSVTLGAVLGGLVAQSLMSENQEQAAAN